MDKRETVSPVLPNVVDCMTYPSEIAPDSD
jgi:hypothetical protein